MVHSHLSLLLYGHQWGMELAQLELGHCIITAEEPIAPLLC